MKFDELDTKMRIFETAHDLCVLPDIFIVARLDGRNFTKLTKETYKFEAPFDVKFRDYAIAPALTCQFATVEHLMNCGFHIIYGYTQSDEISLLMHRNEDAFNRKIRKINSVLAAEASAKLSLLLGGMATFDCRVSQLPTPNLVVDYFRWRNEDAHRNALNAHCYWMLRKKGESARKASSRIEKLSNPDKNELLYQEGNINFNDLPKWQKRGTGLYWESYQKEGLNPVTGERVLANRRRIKVDLELPMKDEYGEFIKTLILGEHSDI